MEKPNSSNASPASGDSDASPSIKPDPGLETASISLVRFWVLVFSIALALFLSLLDSTIVATSLYSIGVDFKDFRRVNWVALAYTLAYLGCAVTIARISDVVGRKKAFVAASIIFFAFSLACGFAQSLDQLIAFRALQGVGGSGLYSLAMIMVPEICPVHLRQYMGVLVGLVIAGSGALGPVLGGILTHYATWRWVFWINGPITFISFVIFLLAWPKPDQLPITTTRSWKEFDHVGSFLVIPAAVLVVYSFQNAGESPVSPWGTAAFIAPLTTGILLWLVLIAWGFVVGRFFEDRVALTFPIHIFKNRAYFGAAISTLFLGFPYFILNYALPLRAQVVDEKSSVLAGVMVLPLVGSAAVGTMVTGVINRTKNYHVESMLTGASLMTVGAGLLTLVHDAGDDAKVLGFITLIGLGFGLSVTSATMVTSLEVPIRDFAPAQGIIAQFRILGGSLGISTSTVFLSNKSSKLLSGLLTPQEQATLGHNGPALSAEQRTAVHQAYSEAFHSDMIAAAATAGAAVLVVLIAYRRGRMLVNDQRTALVQEEAARQSRKGK